MSTLGTPVGALTFAYLAVLPNGYETIIYATNMRKALVLWHREYKREPSSIRQMSDNE